MPALASRSPAIVGLPRCSVDEFARLVDRCVGLCRRQDRPGLAVLWLQAVSLPRLGAENPTIIAAAHELQRSLAQRVRSSVRGSDEVVLLERGEVGVILLGADPDVARRVQQRLVETLDAPFPVDFGVPAPTLLHTSLADFPRQGRSGPDLVRALRLAKTEVHPLSN
jgi:hypothetical protein